MGKFPLSRKRLKKIDGVRPAWVESEMAQRKSYRIQLLYVPDCLSVESARSTFKTSLTQTHVDAVVEELVGDYSSPTILIDGFDVTGRPRGPENQAGFEHIPIFTESREYYTTIDQRRY